MKMDNLEEIIVEYNHTDFNDNHVATSVYLTFKTEEDALTCWKMIGRENQHGYEVPCTVMHPDYSGKTAIHLNMGFGSTNQGLRINTVLDYLIKNFEGLPEVINVKEPVQKTGCILDMEPTATIKLSESQFLEYTLGEFLSRLAMHRVVKLMCDRGTECSISHYSDDRYEGGRKKPECYQQSKAFLLKFEDFDVARIFKDKVEIILEDNQMRADYRVAFKSDCFGNIDGLILEITPIQKFSSEEKPKMLADLAEKLQQRLAPNEPTQAHEAAPSQAPVLS